MRCYWTEDDSPQFQFLWCLWNGLAAWECFDQFDNISIGDALLGHGDCTHESIAQRYELLFQIDCFLVPPNQFRFDFVETENWNRLAVTNAWCSLNSSAFLLANGFIQSSQSVIMETGKVQFSQVASIVHVTNEYIDILCGANTWKPKIMNANS